MVACVQGRKKRAVAPDEAEDSDSEISASKSSDAYDEDVLEGEEEDVQPSIDEAPNRQARSV